MYACIIDTYVVILMSLADNCVLNTLIITIHYHDRRIKLSKYTVEINREIIVCVHCIVLQIRVYDLYVYMQVS